MIADLLDAMPWNDQHLWCEFSNIFQETSLSIAMISLRVDYHN
jgi:hypothetical protein